MRKLLLFLIFVISATTSMAQYRYSIDKCWEMALSNYPVIMYNKLIDNSYNYSLYNVSQAIIPQMPLDNMFPKNDGLLETNKFKLSDRINNLYYGLILLDDKLVISEMTQLYVIEILTEFGVSDSKTINNEANLTKLREYQKEMQELHVKLKQMKILYLDMLSNMIGEEIKGNYLFEKPDISEYLDYKDKIVIEMQDYYKKKEQPSGISVTINMPNITNTIADQFAVPKSSNVDNFSIGESDIKLKSAKSISEIKAGLYDIDVNKSKIMARTDIDNICNKIYALDNTILTYREMILISYKRLGEGKEDVDIFLQNVKNYNELYHTQIGLRVELMMEANKYKVLYE